MGKGFFWRRWKCSIIDCGDGCTTVNILKTIDLYTLNGWIVWYVNYISIKLLPATASKKKTKKLSAKGQLPSTQPVLSVSHGYSQPPSLSRGVPKMWVTGIQSWNCISALSSHGHGAGSWVSVALCLNNLAPFCLSQSRISSPCAYNTLSPYSLARAMLSRRKPTSFESAHIVEVYIKLVRQRQEMVCVTLHFSYHLL